MYFPIDDTLMIVDYYIFRKIQDFTSSPESWEEVYYETGFFCLPLEKGLQGRTIGYSGLPSS